MAVGGMDAPAAAYVKLLNDFHVDHHDTTKLCEWRHSPDFVSQFP